MSMAFSLDYLDYLARLPSNVQAQANLTAIKLRNDRSTPGLNFEKLRGDSGYYSARVNQDVRVICKLQKQDQTPILMYIGHHDDAYKWADRHKVVVSPASGAIQIYETREKIVEVEVSNVSELTKQPVFGDLRDRQLKRLGVPEEQYKEVYAVIDEAGLDDLEKYLPREAYEALFYIFAGDSYDAVINRIEEPEEEIDVEDFETALKRDVTRARIVVCENDFELESLLNQPLAKWRVFLHPEQRKLVERTWNGPVRVLGSAGTGKTVVAYHRAKYLARRMLKDDSIKNKKKKQILFAAYSRTLVTDLKKNLKSICTPEEMKLIDVSTLDSWVTKYIKDQGFNGRIVFGRNGDNQAKDLWKKALEKAPSELEFDKRFYESEFDEVVLANNVQKKTQYFQVSRTGRQIRLNRRQRSLIWPVFDEYLTSLRREDIKESPMLYHESVEMLKKEEESKYRSVIVDETQDFQAFKLKLIRALAAEQQDDLFLVGDGHQRIFLGKPVTLGHCGINIVGRGRKLRINYRTTRQIRECANNILEGHAYDDLDGGTDQHSAIISLTNGPNPEKWVGDDNDQHWQELVLRIQDFVEQEIELSRVCIVARTNRICQQAQRILNENGIKNKLLTSTQSDEGEPDAVRIATAFRIKGLEFDHVIVVRCDHNTFPLGNFERLEEHDRIEKLAVERSLLYVTTSRAKKSVVFLCHGTQSFLLQDALRDDDEPVLEAAEEAPGS